MRTVCAPCARHTRGGRTVQRSESCSGSDAASRQHSECYWQSSWRPTLLPGGWARYNSMRSRVSCRFNDGQSSLQVERVPSKKRAKRKRRGHKSKRDGLSSRVEAIQQVEVFFHDRSREPLLRAHELCCYSVPAQAVEDCAISAVSVYTREVPKAAGVTAKGIISHKLHGVDNTGNVRVWVSWCCAACFFATDRVALEDFGVHLTASTSLFEV